MLYGALCAVTPCCMVHCVLYPHAVCSSPVLARSGRGPQRSDGGGIAHTARPPREGRCQRALQCHQRPLQGTLGLRS